MLWWLTSLLRGSLLSFELKSSPWVSDLPFLFFRWTLLLLLWSAIRLFPWFLKLFVTYCFFKILHFCLLSPLDLLPYRIPQFLNMLFLYCHFLLHQILLELFLPLFNLLSAWRHNINVVHGHLTFLFILLLIIILLISGNPLSLKRIKLLIIWRVVDWGSLVVWGAAFDLTFTHAFSAMR